MATFEASLMGFQVIVEQIKAPSVDRYKEVYEENKDRIYSLAFWMTDNEMTAEEISTRVFCRAFSSPKAPKPEQIDRLLISELRETTPIGNLTLEDVPVSSSAIRGNTKRIHLERAVVQIPATERLAFLMHDVEGYDHARIARTLGITESESRQAVMQARILVRELIAGMQA